MGKKLFSTEEKQKYVSQINELRAQGMNRLEACKKAGLSPSNYFNWTKKGMGGAAARVIIHPEAPSAAGKLARKTKTASDDCVVIVAPMNRLADVLRGLQR